jgi:hypothetical protein
MLFAVPSSGGVNTMIRITGIGDHDRPEWLIRINGIRTLKIHASQLCVWGVMEYREDETGETLAEKAADRGLEAWEIAARLRRLYDIQKADAMLDCSELLGERTTEAVELRRQGQSSVAL